MKRHIVLIILGFTSVMALMISVITYSVIRTDAISIDLQDVHLQQNKKSELVFQMREGQLKRIIVLRNLFLIEDPFEMDEQRMLFYSYAREVNDYRNELLSLDLHPKELKAINRFIEFSRGNGPLQNNLVDQIVEGAKPSELKEALKQAFIGQENAMKGLQEFQQSLNVSNEEALDATLKLNNETYEYVLGFTALASLIAIAIIFYISIFSARQTKSIEDERKKFKILFEKNMDAVVLLRSNKIIEWNQKMEELFNTTDGDQLLGKGLFELSPTNQEEERSSEYLMQQQLNQVNILMGSQFEWQFETFQKKLFFAEVSLVQFDLNEGAFQQVVIKDISERKKAEKIMFEQAHYDLLTNLPNRTYFIDRLEESIERSKINNLKFAVMFIDLDRFKQVNDSLGHQVGDELLREVSIRLNTHIRNSDTAARLGGDEFTVILDNIESVSDVTAIANLIIREISLPYHIQQKDVSIGASIGITLYPDDATNSTVLLSNADMAMYQAKQRGRNKHHYFTQELNTASKSRLELEQDLMIAVEQEQFELYYQPVINVSDNTLEYAEALIRWNHPTRGVISPFEFIPLAEDLGLIKPISQWVLATACQQIKTCQKKGFMQMGLSINVPASELLSGMSMGFIKNTLSKYDVLPQHIVFEITESHLMENTDKSILWLNMIRELGIKISIDDFGTGYSSLSYLKKFPINTLKIDRSFIQDITKDANDQSLVDAMVGIANSLQLNLVAEGVETKQQLDFLKKHYPACSLIQGYYFSKPIPEDEFDQYLQDFNEPSNAPIQMLV